MYSDFYRSRSYLKRWREENPDKVREYQKRSRGKRRAEKWKLVDTDPESYILHQTSENARARGLEFNLDRSDIIIPEQCPLLECLIFFDPENPGHWNTPSLDRIDNLKGYVKGNVWVISKKANTMKNNVSITELKLFAKNIMEIF